MPIDAHIRARMTVRARIRARRLLNVILIIMRCHVVSHILFNLTNLPVLHTRKNQKIPVPVIINLELKLRNLMK